MRLVGRERRTVRAMAIEVAAVLISIALGGPAMAQFQLPKGDEPVNGCSASTEVTLDLLTGATPSCNYEFVCPFVHIEPGDPVISGACEYVVTLDVNGTGSVSGTMAAEGLSEFFGAAGFFVPDAQGQPISAPGPSCGPELFDCSFHTTFDENVKVLLVGPGQVARITCAGGGIAVGESVYCSTTFAVQFPRIPPNP